MQSDAELVREVLNGNKQLFAVLVARYERAARAVAMDILQDRAGSQDAAQDAFVKAYENLGALRKASAFGPWLMKVARRCALTALRQQPDHATISAADCLALESTDSRLDEEKQRLLAAVMRLPESEKQTVMLRYFSGQTVREVAEILGRSVGTVTKQLSRAHRRLRDELERSDK